MKMKKLMYILVVLLSILTFSISYTNQNREDVSILGSFDYYGVADQVF